MELQIGRVIKPHGVRGEVVVDPTTDTPDQRFATGEVLKGKQAGKELSLTVRSFRPHQGRLLVTFEEIADRTAAESLRGVRFFAAPTHDEDDDGFYDYELEGLTAYLLAPGTDLEGDEIQLGDLVGKVVAVEHTPAGQLLVILIDAESQLPTAGKEVLVPFRHQIVPVVELEEEILVLTPPEGLLELS